LERLLWSGGVGSGRWICAILFCSRCRATQALRRKRSELHPELGHRPDGHYRYRGRRSDKDQIALRLRTRLLPPASVQAGHCDQGKADVDKLIEAYKANFEIWREGEKTVHVRYGKINSYGCYCPAARYRPGKPKTDIHCYCTRATHQAIWEAALGHPVNLDILETVRRGDPTCHFAVHLT